MIFQKYARFYDIFYKNKDYQAEITFVEKLINRYGPPQAKTILDLGCGTASHLIPLLKRGYQAVGVDRSSDMLAIAQNKISAQKLPARLIKSELNKFSLNKKFDVVICMFSVINYLPSARRLRQTLRNIYKHMKKDSLFIFDFWNGSAVQRYYTPNKRKVFRHGHQTVERRSTTSLNSKNKTCEVNYVCTFRENGHKPYSFKEKHILRYFTIDQIKKELHSVGFQVLAAAPFMKPNSPIRADTWDITMVAKKP